MRELIAYFRSKVALQKELQEANEHRLALEGRLKRRYDDIDRLEKELADVQGGFASVRRTMVSQGHRLERLQRRIEAQDKTLAPFIRSPWGRVILELPWHEHAGFLGAFFGKPMEDAYAEWKRDKQLRAEAPEAGAGQPTGESK